MAFRPVGHSGDGIYLDSGKEQPIKVTKLFEYEDIDSLREPEVRILERFSRSTGVEILKPVVRKGQTVFQARQYVGVIQLGQHTVQILPKMHSEEPAEAEQMATRNLLMMLDYAGHLGIKEAGTAALRNSKNWFEVLTHIFALNLRRQWVRGAICKYEAIDAVLPVLKGKWRVTDQLRRPEQKHRFTVTYDEFTHDNPLNQILRYVVELLWQLTRDSQNRQMLTELRYWMEDVTLLPMVTPEMAKKISLSRLHQAYKPLFNLAQLFLCQLGVELSGQNIQAYAFVFDMNRVFEGFLTHFLRRHHSEILPPDLQTCRLLPQGPKAIYLAKHQAKPVFRLKPDLVFQNEKTYPFLMDFKYKRLNWGDRKLGISESDFYQMYAYLNRFDSPHVMLLYPQMANFSAPIRASFTLEGSERRIDAATVNLLRDLTERSGKQALIAELKQLLERNNG